MIVRSILLDEIDAKVEKYRRENLKKLSMQKYEDVECFELDDDIQAMPQQQKIGKWHSRLLRFE